MFDMDLCLMSEIDQKDNNAILTLTKIVNNTLQNVKYILHFKSQKG